MDKVNIEINATASKYWARLYTEGLDGVEHEKQIEKTREASVNSNLIQAVIDGLAALKRPCQVDVYTCSEYIVEPFRNYWINRWEKNGWKSAKGKEVRNARQWERLRNLMEVHLVRFLYLEDGR